MNAPTEDLNALLASVDRDDWDGCDAWAQDRFEHDSLAMAAQCVAEVLHRDRERRDACERHGLFPRQRILLRGIARIHALCAGRVVREIEPGSASYGVRTDEAVVAVSCTRPVLVAAPANLARTERIETQLFVVLADLAHVTQDTTNTFRRFDLEPGTINHCDVRDAGTAPGWSSRWRVERGRALAPWLDADDVRAVWPAGGRRALVPQWVQLEQALRRLRLREWLAREHGELGAASAYTARDVDAALDKLELLEALGWNDDLEPLQPANSRIVAALRTGDPAAIARAVRDSLGTDPPI